jgi:hypothetical protein
MIPKNFTVYNSGDAEILDKRNLAKTDTGTNSGDDTGTVGTGTISGDSENT